MRSTRKLLWISLAVSVLALLASIGTGFYHGWGPCGPATIEGMILMTAGMLGILGSGVLLIGNPLLGLACNVWQRFGKT
jgi:hypothetical protein